tara:strand:- start:225 stop:401 length:177 start_codon:yes stop_codon:yes gene_type:complete
MEELTQWLTDNWQTVIVIFFCLEKVVKLSPSKNDDILVDVLFNGVKQLVNKTEEKEEK